MDSYYQDIHIINEETHKEYVRREVHITNIVWGMRTVKIEFYTIMNTYDFIVFNKHNNTLKID